MLIENQEASPLERSSSRARWSKSPHVVGIAPRSVYGHDEADRAWALGILAARGNPRPQYVFGNRRILGVVQGRGPFSPDVRHVRFRHTRRFPWADAEQLKRDWLWAGFPDANNMMNALTGGKFGRTYFAKPATSNGVAFEWYDLWPVQGNPAAGAINHTAFTATNFDDTTTGSMNHRGNVSTDTKHLLSKWAIQNVNTGILQIYDRVLGYDLCTFNASANKTLTNVNTAQRYNSGAPGLMCMIAVCAVTGATAATLTQFRYTNQAGTTLQAMPTTPAVLFIPSAAVSSATLGARIIIPSSGATPTWGFSVPMATGDTGMSLVNDYTTSAANTGSFSIILMHPLAELIMPIAATPFETDSVYQIPELERIYDGACLAALMLQVLTSGYTLQGAIKYGWST